MSRGKGTTSTCSFCGESGHNARGGSCSGVAIAQGLVAGGMSQTEAASVIGISKQAISKRMLSQGIWVGHGAPGMPRRCSLCGDTGHYAKTCSR